MSEIVCPVCSEVFENKLDYNYHLQELYSYDLEHQKFLNSLLEIIKKYIKENDSLDIIYNFNLVLAYIYKNLLKVFSLEEILEIQKKPNSLFKSEKINPEKLYCSFCGKEYYSTLSVPPKTCSPECKEEYRKKIVTDRNKSKKGISFLELYGEEKSKKIRQKISVSSSKLKTNERLFCECGKSRVFKKGTVEKYICRSCKSKSFKYKLQCDNCKTTIYRYKKEVDEVKNEVQHQDGPVFFCSKECYKDFFVNNAQRYKQQRINAGFSSVQSFRNRDNFEYGGVKFASATEMKCAQFLEKELGLKLEERKTCHVIFNNIEVDFVYKNFVIEYHQCHRKTELSLKERIKIFKERHFRYEYRTLEEYYKSRKKRLPKGYNLIVVEFEKEFYKIKDFIKGVSDE